MNTQLPVHAFAAIRKTAALDVDALDLSRVADGASDRTHAAIHDVARAAKKRFDVAWTAMLALVPDELHDAAVNAMIAEGDRIMADRYEKAQVHQRFSF